MTEPSATGLRVIHEHGRSLRVHCGAVELLRYVYHPWDPQLESPRPYFHPIRTLTGDLVSLYRPHDHVWHKGIAWSLANVSQGDHTENFWGGPTFLRGRGYEQLDNDGAMRHGTFTGLHHDSERLSVTEQLVWVTQAGDSWFDEYRGFTVTLAAGGWVLAFATRLVNTSGGDLVLGSPTTQGRDNAGYGGLFWRGPRSFTGGTVYSPTGSGADELMGIRAPWLSFTGRHDEHGRDSTLVFVDGPDNPGHQTQWFVRSQMFACVCPAPFFSTEVPVPPDGEIALRYAVVVADGDPGRDGAEKLAAAGRDALESLEIPERGRA